MLRGHRRRRSGRSLPLSRSAIAHPRRDVRDAPPGGRESRAVRGCSRDSLPQPSGRLPGRAAPRRSASRSSARQRADCHPPNPRSDRARRRTWSRRATPRSDGRRPLCPAVPASAACFAPVPGPSPVAARGVLAGRRRAGVSERRPCAAPSVRRARGVSALPTGRRRARRRAAYFGRVAQRAYGRPRSLPLRTRSLHGLVRTPRFPKPRELGDRLGDRTSVGVGLQHGRDLRDCVVGAVTLANAGCLLDHRGKRPECDPLAVRKATSTDYGRLLTEPGDELVDEPRLADSGRTQNGNEPTAPLRDARSRAQSS